MKVIILLGVIALATAFPGKRDRRDSGPTVPPNYNFRYQVVDSKSGNKFGHREQRLADDTQGSYYVRLPGDDSYSLFSYRFNPNGENDPPVTLPPVPSPFEASGSPVIVDSEPSASVVSEHPVIVDSEPASVASEHPVIVDSEPAPVASEPSAIADTEPPAIADSEPTVLPTPQVPEPDSRR